MPRVAEDQILKIHATPSGQLWIADGMETPVRSDRSGFLASVEGRETIHLRVLGTRENAPLIVELHRSLARWGRGTLEIGSPQICENAREREDGRIAIYRMRQCLLSGSLGGWHAADESDLRSYELVQAVRSGDQAEIERCLRRHPVWHDLTFIPTLDRSHAAKVLASIVDPRWFIDLRHPERLSRMTKYLGLLPYYMSLVASGRDFNLRRVHRAASVLKSWHRDGHPEDMGEPGNFLWRRWVAAKSSERGNLVASQAFLAFLVRTWQDRIYNSGGRKLDFFVPDMLLRGDEIEAYRRHCEGRDAV